MKEEEPRTASGSIDNIVEGLYHMIGKDAYHHDSSKIEKMRYIPYMTLVGA